MRFVRSADTRCDPVDISQECCIQHHEREHNRRFDEGTTLGGNVNQTPSGRIVRIMVLNLVPHRLE